jgi:hypothetical protein
MQECLGVIKVDSSSSSFKVDAVGSMAANAGYTAKGVVQVHIYKVVDIPMWTFRDFHDDVGGGNVLDPEWEDLGTIWSGN